MRKFLDEYGSAIAYIVFALGLIAGLAFVLHYINVTPAYLS